MAYIFLNFAILTSLFYIMVIATSAGSNNSLSNIYKQQGLL
jgi:hypothetical protein